MYISFPTSKYICNMMYLYIIYIFIFDIFYISTYAIVILVFCIYNNLRLFYQQCFHYTITSKKVCVFIYIYLRDVYNICISIIFR